MSATSSPTRSSRVSTPVSTKSTLDEDESPVKMPRGGLAARMLGASAFEEEKSSSEDDEEDAHQIYLKMRQQMMAAKEDATRPVKATTVPDAPDSPVTRSSPPRNRRASPSSPMMAFRQLSHSPTSSRHSTPGLFISPAKPARAARATPTRDSDSDSDLPATNSVRFQELLARRREERLAKEEAERRKLEARAAREAQNAALFEEEEEQTVPDDVIEDRLTQQARPTRKASKKALEEMHRETQRMSRNMQLTHQAKVKKRFTMQDFLAGFNNKQGLHSAEPKSDPVTASSAPASSDVDAHRASSTPPSSPPSVTDDIADKDQHVITTQATKEQDELEDDKDLPSLEHMLSQPATRVDKGKSPAPQEAAATVQRTILPAPRKLDQRRFRVLPPPRQTGQSDSSDDDLEIIKDRFSVFDSVPARKASESSAFLNLRHLAQIGASDNVRTKKGKRPSVTPAQLDLDLRKRAGLQARHERDEKLAALRARGINVLTEEEREKEQMEIENMLDKARQEAAELGKKERRAAKASGVEEQDALASEDESEDDDYAASDEGGEEKEADAAEVVLSGSEDEDEEMLEASDGEDEAGGMVDDEAGEDSQAESEGDAHQDDETDVLVLAEDASPMLSSTVPRAHRRRLIIDDDDDDDEDMADTTVVQQQPQSNAIATPSDNLAAAFGFGPVGAAPMGLTQMFAGTMAGSQDDSQMTIASANSQDRDSLNIFRFMPSAPLPALDHETQDMVVENTQTTVLPATQQQSQDVQLVYTQSPAATRESQFSQIPDPSQDAGFDLSRSPAGFVAPYSTADTVVLPVPESPVVQKRGRLMRRVIPEHESDDEDLPAVADVAASAGAQNKTTAFDIMRKAATKPAEIAFDKKKSGAKTMVDEAAEESEDEYAGLGGASDDESGGEADEADRQMIDESDVKVDERQIAAYHAEKARAENEAQTSKLYKDLMSGALRRKRTGGAFDLDSDEDDQLAERRRRKQREEARMRRLLLDDENLGKLNGNEKKEAFLRAIEDRDEDDEDGDVLDDDAEDSVPDSQVPDSQQASQQASNQHDQPLDELSTNAVALPAKRKRDDGQTSQPSSKKSRLPGALRRTPATNAAFRKPTSLAEVRESVSFLIEEQNALEQVAMASDSDGDDEYAGPASAAADRPAFAARRTAASTAPKADIVDRLLLKRTSTLTAESGGSSAAGGLAYATASTRSISAFNTPSLLRRTTTASTSSANANAHSAAAARAMPPPALPREGSSSMGVRMGGSKKSSIHYQAREAERRVVVERAERKRAENVARIAGLRRGGSAGGSGGLGALFGVGFE